MTSSGSQARFLTFAIAGAALVVGGVVAYFIDADPAEIFGNPVASLILVAAGAGLGYLAWRAMPREPRSDDE